MHDHTWRQTTPHHAARWLTWLASFGYQLADIETKVVVAGTATEPGGE